MSLRLSIVVLVCLVFATVACTPKTGTPTLGPSSPKQEMTGKLDEYLKRLNELGFSGSVLIAQHGEVLLSKGYGAWDQNGANPITPETIFAIGSNTKPFTAAAILKLQDQGLLHVNDPLSVFFPDAPADKAGITLHQLMSHSSGLDHSGIFNGDFEVVSRDEAVGRILKSRLLFKPGTDSSYSDYGYILLAAVIEKVSGSNYQEYIRKELLTPAGMTHTGWWGEDLGLSGQPVHEKIKRLPGPYWSIMGAGGMVASVSDLYQWHLALLQGKILSKDSLKAYSTVQFRIDEKGGEGYGWMVLDEPGKRVRAHAGGTPQLSQGNVMRWYMDEDLLIIASSGSEELKAEDVVPNLARIVFELPYASPPEVTLIDSSLLHGYAGRYQIDPQNFLTVTSQGDRLLITGEGQQAFNLLFQSDQDIRAQSTQSAVVDYLSSRVDSQLEQWKKHVSQRLGLFKEFKVIGTAPLLGSGEPWTFVSFEFERGSALTRWIVSPACAAEAAQFDSEPPYLVCIPQGGNRFAPFSLSGQPSIQEVSFSAAGLEVTMAILTLTSEWKATKLPSQG